MSIALFNKRVKGLSILLAAPSLIVKATGVYATPREMPGVPFEGSRSHFVFYLFRFFPLFVSEPFVLTFPRAPHFVLCHRAKSRMDILWQVFLQRIITEERQPLLLETQTHARHVWSAPRTRINTSNRRRFCPLARQDAYEIVLFFSAARGFTRAAVPKRLSSSVIVEEETEASASDQQVSAVRSSDNDLYLGAVGAHRSMPMGASVAASTATSARMQGAMALERHDSDSSTFSSRFRRGIGSLGRNDPAQVSASSGFGLAMARDTSMDASFPPSSARRRREDSVLHRQWPTHSGEAGRATKGIGSSKESPARFRPTPEPLKHTLVVDTEGRARSVGDPAVPMGDGAWAAGSTMAGADRGARSGRSRTSSGMGRPTVPVITRRGTWTDPPPAHHGPAAEASGGGVRVSSRAAPGPPPYEATSSVADHEQAARVALAALPGGEPAPLRGHTNTDLDRNARDTGRRGGGGGTPSSSSQTKSHAVAAAAGGWEGGGLQNRRSTWNDGREQEKHRRHHPSRATPHEVAGPLKAHSRPPHRRGTVGDGPEAESSAIPMPPQTAAAAVHTQAGADGGRVAGVRRHLPLKSVFGDDTDERPTRTGSSSGGGGGRAGQKNVQVATRRSVSPASGSASAGPPAPASSRSEALPFASPAAVAMSAFEAQMAADSVSPIGASCEARLQGGERRRFGGIERMEPARVHASPAGSRSLSPVDRRAVERGGEGKDVKNFWTAKAPGRHGGGGDGGIIKNLRRAKHATEDSSASATEASHASRERGKRHAIGKAFRGGGNKLKEFASGGGLIIKSVGGGGNGGDGSDSSPVSRAGKGRWNRRTTGMFMSNPVGGVDNFTANFRSSPAYTKPPGAA